MKRKLLIASEIIVILLLAATFIACCNGGSDESPSSTPTEEGILTESGLRYIEIEEGFGPQPRVGDFVMIHYVGTLEDGTEFDNTRDRDFPQPFTVDKLQTITGLDLGVRLMKEGGKARLVVPPELGYGSVDTGRIPANSTLIFEVELVSVIPAPPPGEVAEEDYEITETGLKYYDMAVGDGDSPEAGQMVLIVFSMWLADGTQIRTPADTNGPTTMVIGSPDALAGLSEGLASMHEGGVRQLVIPPDLGHGEEGTEGGTVPPNETLTVEVGLIAVVPWEPDPPTEVDEADYTTTDSGLKYYDLAVGSGNPPEPEQAVVVQFTGWLTDGTQFTSSLDLGQPISAHKLGSGNKPEGFDEGVLTMQVGGKRQLVIPPELGFGEEELENVPANSTLIYEVELFYAFDPSFWYL
ncbi:MAG: FKBP-type peptidyl-prolyl cis-trans isomerase [Chloroflexi bacterium]|nr:FKBP-type peptidyl-prolyl cis-trans isomerase [Chloroflexota bacterium]